METPGPTHLRTRPATTQTIVNSTHMVLKYKFHTYGTRSHIYGTRSYTYGTISYTYGTRSHTYGTISHIYGTISHTYGTRHTLLLGK